jgi:predicted dehydrogenase
MIRLALIGAEEVTARGIALRLGKTELEVAPDISRCSAPPTAWDAVAFVEIARPEKGTIQRLLDAGKHVLLATEPYLSWDEMRELREAAQQAEVRFAVVNPERYLPSRQLIREQLVNHLGAPGLVRIHRWEPGSAKNASASPQLPGPMVGDLDLALWLIGETPNRLYSLEQGAGEDLGGRCVQVHLGFPGGGMALIDYANRLPPGDSYRMLAVIASAGAAYADDHSNMQLAYRGGRPQAVQTEEGMRQWTVLLQNFVEELRAGWDAEAGTASWHAVFKVVEAVKESLARRRAVALEDH